MKKIKIEFKETIVKPNSYFSKMFINEQFIGNFRFDKHNYEGILDDNSYQALSNINLSLDKLDYIALTNLPKRDVKVNMDLEVNKKNLSLADIFVFDYFIVRTIESEFIGIPLCVIFTENHCYMESSKDPKIALQKAYSQVEEDEFVIREFLIKSKQDIDALRIYDFDDEDYELTQSTERTVILADDYGDLYVITNASKKEIEKAIMHRNEVREEDDSPLSDFEIIQKYLESKGKIFSEISEPEKYYW